MRQEQDDFGYSQGERGRFERGGRDSPNRSNNPSNEGNWSTGSIGSSNSRSRLDNMFDKSKVKCYNCQKTGHYARNCWNPTKRVEENANLMIEEEKEATLLLVHNERMQDKENMWYLDNGASNHMCGDKDKFMELDKAIRGNVTLTDHSKVAIKGKNMILIKLKEGSHQFIGDVYYIPTMKSNILSLGKLLEKGYKIKMKDCSLTLLDTKGDMIAKVVMTKNRMLLNIETNMPKCMCER